MKMFVCLLIAGLAALAAANPASLPWTSDDPWHDKAVNRAASTTTCDCGWVNRGRIVGGKETRRNEYPLVVHVVFPQTFCGGTIITPWHVLTAAHCTDGERAQGIRIFAGAHRSATSNDVYRVARIIDHERYNPETTENDISILLTSTQIRFNQNIGPACLPSQKLSLSGQSLKALGWGLTKHKGLPSSALQEVDLPVISNPVCRRYWGALIKDTNLCSQDPTKDTCQGDSGGPLIWLDPSTNRYTIAALVSFGAECGSGTPGVNTDVSAYLDWINRQVAASKPGTATCRKA